MLTSLPQSSPGRFSQPWKLVAASIGVGEPRYKTVCATDEAEEAIHTHTAMNSNYL